MARRTGRYERTRVGGEDVAAFIPHPLPPRDPPLVLDAAARDLLARAERELSRLELAGDLLPAADALLNAFMRKEAVTSSQIDGVSATLADLLAVEAAPLAAPTSGAVASVRSCVEALCFARSELRRDGGLRPSMRLLNLTHERLLRGAPGAERGAGEVRCTQNWVGGPRPGSAVFVPPPPQFLGEALAAFERYLDGPDDLPPLVRVGLAHVQFEAIHPYLDGNGRTGRILIALLLEHWRLLTRPLLCLSLFFKRHRREYYRLLGAVGTSGDWEGWTRFFLEGVAATAAEAIATARQLSRLIERDRARVLAAAASSVMAARLLEVLPRHPVVTIARVTELLGTTKPTAAKAVAALVAADVLREGTGRKRDRTFGYAAFVERLRAGTELEAHGA